MTFKEKRDNKLERIRKQDMEEIKQKAQRVFSED